MTNDNTPPLGVRPTRFARQALSRRSVLAGAGGVGLAAALAACGTGGTEATGSGQPTPKSQADKSDTDKQLRWNNWPYYMDNAGGKGSTLATFESQSGVNVNYTENIEDNGTFYDSVKAQLAKGLPTGYDLVVLTDWMADKWIRLGYALPLNNANIPNKENLRKQLTNQPFDPERGHTLPWQSGFAGLGFNKKVLKDLTGKTEIKTVDELWDPKLKGRITVLSEMRDTVGLIMMASGKNPADFTDAEFQDALSVVQEQVDNGQIRKVAGNDYVAALDNDEVAAAFAWSGDLFGSEKNVWVQPESGATYWTDNMLIPAMAAHQKNAERAMNFYYDPVNQGTMIAGGVTYVTPVPDAKATVEKLDKSLADNPLIFPTDEYLKNTAIFMSLPLDQSDMYQAAFDDAVGL